MRNRFDAQLTELSNQLITMGALCEEAISTSVQALMDEAPDGEGDAALRAHVYEIDSEIDHKERDIEDLCMKLLLQQQPVARDLRVISSALKMISDMERIGDQASDIADLTGFIKKGNLRHRIHLRQMARETIKMVSDAVDSFVRKDLELARAVIDYDDVVDKLFTDVKSELISLVAADAENGELYLDLLMVAKYFERIGDHATNIAEWVEYSITGIRVQSELPPALGACAQSGCCPFETRAQRSGSRFGQTRRVSTRRVCILHRFNISPAVHFTF